MTNDIYITTDEDKTLIKLYQFTSTVHGR